MPAEVLTVLRETLRAHRPADEREAEAIGRILSALEDLPRPLDRAADHTHVTGSAIVVGRRGVLLHRHKRMGIWMQPGGHLDVGESPWDAAVREAAEETGIRAAHPPGGPRLVHVDVHAASGGHTHLDLRYLLHAEDADPAPPPGESPAVRWFPWADAVAVADAGLVGALRSLRR